MKVVFNGRYGGFGLSEKAEKMLAKLKHVSEVDTYEIPRHDPDLVKVVEELGDEANGYCANLRIKEIKGNKYIIDDYDGLERVLEPDDIDWVEV
jgi:hypothetical protein